MPTTSPFTNNHKPLTRRELEVMAYAYRGLSAPEIASILNRSPRTIENHIRSIYQKLEIHNRVELLRVAQQLGLDNDKVLEDTIGHDKHISDRLHLGEADTEDSTHTSRDRDSNDLSDLFCQSKAFDILSRIDHALARVDTDDYPLVLARALSTHLQVRWAGLSEAATEDELITIIVCTDHGTLVEQCTCVRTVSPCGKVLEVGSVICQRDLKDQFPDWDLGRQMGAQSYVGVRLEDRLLGPIGTLWVIDDKPMPHADMCSEILSLYARRTAAELAISRTIDQITEASQGDDAKTITVDMG